MRSVTITAALATALVAAFAASAGPAAAAVSSASINGPVATLNLDGANDNETVSVSGGLLIHTSLGGGLNSVADWDSSTPGDQTVPADGTFTVIVNGGDGNDSITVLARTNEIASATLNGEGGDDVLTGADTADTVNGGDGNDRLVGAKGIDVMNGGAGNDTLVWNNGDGSDRMNGDTGNDLAEVNGAPTLGDVFTLAPEPGGVKFQRTNLVPFTLDTATERFQVNGLGGDDSVTAQAGVGALTQLSVDGGTGNDAITGSDGPDALNGGDGNDVVNGGGGDDRISGDRGNDTMNGDAGDDTLVWNNGDGTDVMNGDDGRDDVEVNGSPTAGDMFTIQPNGQRIKFDRTNLVPFSLDVGSSETMHANGLGGDDTITIGDVGDFSVTAAGGSGNDILTGGASSDTLLGGTGNDKITAGAGVDFVSGGEGDDTVNVRDNTADIGSGGSGSDSVIADAANLDVLDGFETVDRPPVITPAPVVTPAPVITPTLVITPALAVAPGARPADTTALPAGIGRGTVKVTHGVAAIRLSCPAASPVNCTGSLRLRTARSAKSAGRKTVRQLGSTRYNVAPGHTVTLKVKLAKSVQRLADRNGHLKVVAVAVTDASGKSSSRSATLALGRAKRP